MTKRKFLSDDDVNKVLNHIRTTKHSARNRCIFLLGLRLGMTVKELSALTVSDVVEANSIKTTIYLESKKTKGKNGKTFTIDDDLKCEIQNYLVTKYKSESLDILPKQNPLFSSQKHPNKSFTPNALSQVMKDILLDAGLENVSSGSLKKSYITNVLSTDDPTFITSYAYNNEIIEAKLNGWLQSIGRQDIRVKLETVK